MQNKKQPTQNRGLFFRVILSGALFLIFHPKLAFAQQQRPWAFFLYSGAAIERNVPLVQILRLSVPHLEQFYQATLGVDYRFFSGSFLNLEAETSLTQHFETADRVAAQGAIVVRITEVPWKRTFPGSFAFGNGLSYAAAPPRIEELALGRSSRWFYYLFIEFEFLLGKQSEWSALMRVHHRSGIFGIFDGISGGSDYLCLGTRFYF